MKNVKLLDGGMGREIKKNLRNFDPILWSASALLEAPDLVIKTHRKFIDAGSDIITTNNYTCVPYVLKQKNILDQFEFLSKKAGELARKSAECYRQKKIKVAGCIPPLHLTYRSDLANKEYASETYGTIINCLEPYVDLFLAESISSRIHFDTILSTLDSVKKPMYLSFLVDDNNPNQLLDSTPLSSLICDLNHSRVGAILLNCCQPQTVSHALLNFNNLSCEFGAYANTFKKLTKQFENGDLRTLDSSIDADHYLDHVIDWIEKGASIVGGCCGVGPEYISRINDYLLTKK